MSKHTEGPWVHEMNDFGGQIEITAGSREGRVEIAAVQIGYDEPFESEQIANAHLMAASPDLLSVLESAFTEDGRCYPAVMESVEWRTAARAAIAKAKGETSD